MVTVAVMAGFSLQAGRSTSGKSFPAQFPISHLSITVYVFYSTSSELTYFHDFSVTVHLCPTLFHHSSLIFNTSPSHTTYLKYFITVCVFSALLNHSWRIFSISLQFTYFQPFFIIVSNCNTAPAHFTHLHQSPAQSACLQHRAAITSALCHYLFPWSTLVALLRGCVPVLCFPPVYLQLRYFLVQLFSKWAARAFTLPAPPHPPHRT